MNKLEALYIPPAVNITSHECGTCTMFRKPHRCTLVTGNIERHGVCRHWEAKK